MNVTMLIDSSGSMNQLGSAPLDSINEFIGTLSATGRPFVVNLWHFSDKLMPMGTQSSVDGIKRLDREDYKPQGRTALYDAIGKLLKENTFEPGNTLVILTDGEDTCSRREKASTVKTRLEALQTSGVRVVYLGANQDPLAVADSVGIRESIGYDYSPAGITQIMRQMSASICEIDSGSPSIIDSVP